ncbi:MAG: UDP-2,4-diacetamido-2,4,6-trideoxy-beta-L-altropyranose hydrolase [Pseudomonadota bacterium]
MTALPVARRIALRADASPVLGSGHVMRCLSLAEALRARGAQVHFICRAGPGHLGGRIQAQGFGLSLLGADLSPAQDADQTRAALAAGCDLLLVDHYGLGAAWEQALRPLCRHLAAIDDLADRRHAVDLLLDQNLGRQRSDYAALLPAHASRLIGPAYALLRPEFAAARAASLARRPTAGWRHLLLSLGGADPQQATVQVLHALARCRLPADARLTVVLGALAPTRAQVQALLPSLPCPTRLLVDVADMAGLLAEADLAIGAAGGSAWERCCLGLPSLLLVLAENQRSGNRALVAAGAALALGEVADLPTSLPAALRQLADPGRLQAMSQAAAAITDGQGAARVADALLALH